MFSSAFSRLKATLGREEGKRFLYPFQDIIYPIKKSSAFFDSRKRQRFTASFLVFTILFQTVALVFIPNNIFHVPSAEAATNWFDSGYGYRKLITIDKAKVAGNLAYFPVLVSLIDPALKSSLNGGRVVDSAYLDIMFADAAGTMQLDHEIEKYEPTTGEIIAWVKLPALSSAVDTSFYIYYGNDTLAASEENTAAVWDEGGADNFKLVQHMNQNPAGTAPQMLDSTRYGNNGTSNGGMVAANSVAGKIDGATSFDGADDYINCGSSSLLAPQDRITASAIVKTNDLIGDDYIVSLGRDYFGSGFNLLRHGNTIRAYINLDDVDNTSEITLTSNSILNVNDYWIVSFTYDSSLGGKLYVNGNLVQSSSLTGPIVYRAGQGNNLIIGRLSAANAYPFSGNIDEVRISNTVRSAEWIATEYNNQSQPTEFASLGIEEVYNAPALSTFGYRKAITIDHTKVAGDLTNFPVLVNLPADAQLKARVQDYGKDILFTAADKDWSATTNDKLAHEVESYDPATGSLTAWVKVPALSNASDTVIYMYYGSGESADQQNKTVVWDSSTKLVQHMHQNPGGTAPQMLDSSLYGHDGTSAGDAALVAGKIGGAQSLDGDGDYFDVGSDSDLDITQAITASAWFYTETIPPAYYSLVGEYYCASNGSYELYLGGSSQVIWATALTPDTRIKTVGTQPFLGAWHYAASTFSFTDQKQIVYVDGVKKIEQARTTPLELSTRPLKIGGGPYSVGYLNGKIDEVRIASVARSAEWIQTEYNNQSQPNEFASLGIEETYYAPTLSSFGYRKAITIDHTKVSGDLVNFPVLINLPADASLAAYAQDADFDDVLFTSSNVSWNTGSANDKLAHEIESFDPNTGELVAWVRVPALSATVDTTIYMYYGHSSVASQQNPTAVWDANTKMVQHMNQAGTGSVGDYEDSTQYGNDSMNTAGQPASTTGKIGNAESFDGNEDYMDMGDRASLNVTTDSITIEAWTNWSQFYSDGGGHAVISKSNNASGGYMLYQGTSAPYNVVKFFVISDGANRTVTTATSFDTNRWYHLTAVYNGSSMLMYVNGVQDANTNAQSGNIKLALRDLIVGSTYSSSGAKFNGSLDEVRISNTARSAEWISTEYQNQSNPTEFVSLGIEEVENAPDLSTFAYRKAITIDHTKVAGDLTNFPVLINLPADAGLAARAQNEDFDDVLFAADDVAWNTGSVNDKLAHEIEKFDANTGALVAWVKIPNLSSTVDTVIYMYYGNGIITSQQNKTAVWDTNTKMVQHMHQTGTGQAGDYRDSAQYGNDSTNTTSQPTVTTAGKIGNAESFNGTDSVIAIGDSESLDISNHITISTWVKKNSPDAIGNIIAKDLPVDPWRTWQIYEESSGGFFGYVNTDSGSNWVSFADSPAAGEWYYLVSSYDGSNVKTFVNGVSVTTYAASGLITDSPSAINIGNWGGSCLSGSIDEVRIASTARSAEWIATEYNNQSDPDTFYSLGIEEVENAPDLSDFAYRKAITIDHTKVSGDLTNFPVLISLPADAGLAAHAQDDFDDVLFTSDSVSWNTGTANDKLAHEIESFNPDTGELVAWVRVPALSATVDTTIYLYYGHDTIAGQQNKFDVWDSNTKLVQHMGEDPTSANPAPQMLDSTRYANHGTTSGTMLSEDRVGGEMGSALDLDGLNDYVDCGDRDSTEVTGAVTASAWIKTGSMAQFKTVLGRQFGGGYGTYALTPTGTANFNFVIRLSTGNKLSPAVNFAALNDNVFHYLVGVYDGARVRLYLDGTEVGTGTAATGDIVPSTGNLRLGVYQTGGVKYGGLLDEVRVADVGRSAEWIQTEYRNQSSPATFYALAAEQVYRLEISGAGTQTAGQGQTITLTARDAAGQVLTGFNGEAAVTFSGASASGRGTNPSCNYTAFGSPTTLTFVSGVATCALRLYKAEAAEVAVSGFSTTANTLAVSVVPNLHHNYLVQAPAAADSGESFAATITARDYEYNPVSISGDTALAVSAGGVSPTSIPSSGFTNGVWNGDLTVSGIVERPSVTVTATKSGHTGSDNITVLGLPQAPGSVSASRDSDTQMALAWQDLSTVEVSYEIERRTLDAGGWGSYQLIASTSAGTTSFVDNAANHPAAPPQADRAYQYRVRAQNSIGYGAYAADPAVHYTAPGVPSGVSAERLSDAGFRINYVDNAAVTDNHRLQRCSGGNCSSVFETDLGVFSASPQSDSSGIAADSRYRWQARSETPDGLASAWALSSFEYTTPGAPVIAEPIVVSADAITVQWADNSAYEDGFRVEVSVDGGAYAEITPGVNTVGANIASYSFACLGDHNYQFRVRAHVGATTDNGQLFSPYSGASSVVYTPSAPPTIQAPVVDSSTAITWHWTDNSAYEEAFHLDFVTGAGPDADDIPAGTVSRQTAGLTPNTAYSVHLHSYRADSGESAASAASEEVYTLASQPAGLSVTAEGASLTAGWEANANPAGTEYFVENISAGTNSGWITDRTWTASDLLCGMEYAFRVKARNRANVETAFAPSVSQMTIGCGGGLLPGAHNPPQAPGPSAENPAGAFGLLINGGESYANRTSVRLSLFAGSDTKHVALSNRADFKDASLVAYQPEIMWELEEGEGQRTVYARFYTRYGVASQNVSACIRLDTEAPSFTLLDLRDEYSAMDDIFLEGTTEAEARIGYNLDGQRAGVVNAAGGAFALALGVLAPGPHALQLFAQDAAGNASAIIHYPLLVARPPAPAPSEPAAPPTGRPAPSGSSLETPTGEAPSGNQPLPPVLPPEPSIEAPAALRGEWDLLSPQLLPRALTGADIELLVERFPEFKQTFARLGIQNFHDSTQLQRVSLELPTLGEVTGLAAGALGVSGLPAPGTPLVELPASVKKDIPENFVFVRTQAQGIDVTTALTFEQGNAGQKVALLAGQTFELIIRPDQEVAHIKGYITFLARPVAQATPSAPAGWARRLQPAALAAPEMEEKLVLSEFDYADADGDGLWTAELQIPPLAGEYEVITVLDYKDVNIGPKSIRMITVVDPEGYVYELSGGKETRIPDALVRLFWFDPDTRSYELWDASRYQQQNPQTTDRSGTYSFLVPTGSYYLSVEAPGYQSYRGEPFQVSVGDGVHANIELQPVRDWREQLTWERALLALLGAALLYNFYSDWRARRRAKKAAE